MKFVLQKMSVTLASPIQYRLKDDQNVQLMNDLIGKNISLTFLGKIYCASCKEPTKKSIGQGFCYPCFLKSPDNSECIIRPELCLGHEGKGRDVLWELENHVQEHIVYLALTSAVKVGITRKTNLTTRWIDQGAWKTIVLAQTPNRYLCGKIEVALKDFLSDKTNWQKMLKNEKDESIDLLVFKQDMIKHLPSELKVFVSPSDEVQELIYPVNHYPEKVSSESFDKTPIVNGKLIGIRGQYLIFDGGKVINIRKFTGYEVELNFDESQNEESPKQMSLF